MVVKFLVKVLFIIVPEVTYIGASAHESVERRREPRPQLGILYVASYLQKFRADVSVQIVDCPSCGIDYTKLAKIINRINGTEYEAVAFEEWKKFLKI